MFCCAHGPYPWKIPLAAHAVCRDEVLRGLVLVKHGSGCVCEGGLGCVGKGGALAVIMLKDGGDVTAICVSGGLMVDMLKGKFL